MTENEWAVAIPAVWAIVAIVITGIWREVTGKWPSSDDFDWTSPSAMIALWPMTIILIAILGVVGVVVYVIRRMSPVFWIGRAPVRLVKFIISKSRKSNLPKATPKVKHAKD